MEPVVVSTGQHRDMLDQINRWFGIEPDFDLNVFQHGATLTQLSAKILERLPEVLQRFRPDAVLVQGDTTTVAIAAIACFYEQIPVVHLEAGLRSGDIHSPFPEEANRKLAGQVTALHLAPTTLSRENLLREAFDGSAIPVVGNTVIDALEWTIARPVEFADPVSRRGTRPGGRWCC
nr:UDP-N-acetylglucosamine 2-epimerase [Tessaracoccus coleopterorum]